MKSEGLYGSASDTNTFITALAEFLGTYLFLLAGMMCVVLAGAGPASDLLTVPLAFGLGLMVSILMFGHISGAHYNPTVTLALAVTGTFPWKNVLGYIPAQLLGGIAAAITVSQFGPGTAAEDLAMTVPTPVAGSGFLINFAAEVLGSFLFMIVITALATDTRVPKGFPALGVGFALMTMILIFGHIAGGSFNPARALGPMIALGSFPPHWLSIYVGAPGIGMTLAALLYTFVLKKGSKPKE